MKLTCAARGSDDHVEVPEERPPLLHELNARAIRVDVIDRRDELRGAEGVWPGECRLLHHLLHLSGEDEILESRAGFRLKDQSRADLELWQLDWNEIGADAFEHLQCGIVLDLGRVLNALCVRRVALGQVECRLDVTDA